jgi:hypothetical protein
VATTGTAIWRAENGVVSVVFEEGLAEAFTATGPVAEEPGAMEGARVAGGEEVVLVTPESKKVGSCCLRVCVCVCVCVCVLPRKGHRQLNVISLQCTNDIVLLLQRQSQRLTCLW